jgi:diguanylate cyclase (GGDEF)-like protein
VARQIIWRAVFLSTTSRRSTIISVTPSATAPLKIVANVCNSAKRDSDISARIGGEEFALLLPETNEAAALVVAERRRVMVRECSPTVHGEKLNLRVSIGIATATPSMSGLATLIKRGDDALYEAKRSGRDCVSVVSVVGDRKIAAAAE